MVLDTVLLVLTQEGRKSFSHSANLNPVLIELEVEMSADRQGHSVQFVHISFGRDAFPNIMQDPENTKCPCKRQRQVRERRYSSTVFETQHEIKKTGRPHATTSLSLGRNLPSEFQHELCGPQMCSGRFGEAGNRTKLHGVLASSCHGCRTRKMFGDGI
jgi:hypothetical protein